MNKSLTEYFESDIINNYLIKIEDINMNCFPYQTIWKQSKNEITTDYVKILYIDTIEWFDEVIPLIAKFDYVQLTTNGGICNYGVDLSLNTISFRSELRKFSSLEEIQEYLISTQNNFKRTCIQSINKIIIISDDFKKNEVIWQIKSSEFDIDIKSIRDKKLNQILENPTTI